LVGTAALVLMLYPEQPVYTFSSTFVSDAMSAALKVFVCIAVFTVFLYSRQYLRDRGSFKGEFFVLGLTGLLGMMVLMSAHNLLTIYLGLELLSLSLYAMVAMQRDSATASESAMKYFVLGALASGMLLYGMSLLYGVTGSLDLGEINARVSASVPDSAILVFALVFVVVGVAFKLGAVPFHMWIPDVYQGAPTAVTIYVATAPKVAAFAMLIRLMVDGLSGLSAQWHDIFVLLAILSMGVGNVIAIAQANLKRMLAYSAIAHVGYLLLGVLTGTKSGYAASMFYSITYVLMGLGAFGMVLLLSREGFEAEKLDDYKGLNERSPWFAFMMLILMFSMAGVPPGLGFWAKLQVLKEVVAADMVWLAVTAVLFSIIGAFYYLRVVKLMYFDEPVDTAPLSTTADMRVTLSANALAVLVLGLYPTALMALCVSAFA
jgi:NADH-quinone oxidoreductase subunit N